MKNKIVFNVNSLVRYKNRCQQSVAPMRVCKVVGNLRKLNNGRWASVHSLMSEKEWCEENKEWYKK